MGVNLILISLEYHIKWKMTLDLESVKDGGLQIKSSFEPPTLVPVKTTLDGLESYQNYTLKAVQTATNNMDDLRKALAEDLQGQQGLCLPAGGVFYSRILFSGTRETSSAQSPTTIHLPGKYLVQA